LYAVYVSRRQIPLAVSAFTEFAGEKIRTTLSGARRRPSPGEVEE
jgi:hypothetical protein